MKSQIHRVMRNIRDLPYSDTLELCGLLAEQLDNTFSAHHIADSLMKVRETALESDRVASNEDALMRQMLGKKRGFTIRVTKEPSGWRAVVENDGGAFVVGPYIDDTARAAVATLLDNMVAIYAMQKA